MGIRGSLEIAVGLRGLCWRGMVGNLHVRDALHVRVSFGHLLEAL